MAEDISTSSVAAEGTTANVEKGSAKSQAWLKALLKDPLEIAQHTAAFIASILSIWLVHYVLAILLGGDAKFYDRIPVRYVTDTGHLAVLVRFVWNLVVQIWRRNE